MSGNNEGTTRNTGIISIFAAMATVLAFFSLVMLLKCEKTVEILCDIIQLPVNIQIHYLTSMIFVTSAVVLWFFDFYGLKKKEQQDDKEISAVRETKRRKELIIEEYKLAQTSAEHHDRLIWYSGGLVWGANFILLGIILGQNRDLSPLLVQALSIAGILLILCIWRMIHVWNGVMRTKYERCHEIERVLDFKQHLMTKGNYPPGKMKSLYGIISITFLILWLFVGFISPLLETCIE